MVCGLVDGFGMAGGRSKSAQGISMCSMYDTCRVGDSAGRRCLPQAVQAAAEADIALLVVSAKGRELEAALREVGLT